MITKRFRTVTIELPAGAVTGTEIPFPDQEDLREAIIEGFETFSETDAIATPQGGTVVTDADARSLSLVLADKSTARAKFVPYNTARRSVNSGVVRQMRDMVITWTQSKVRVNSTLASGEVTYAVVGVHYRYASDKA